MKYIKYLLIICFILIPLNTYAQTLGGLKAEYQKMQNDYNKNRENRKLTEQEIASLKQKIHSINDEIDTINNDIDDLNKQIEARYIEIDKMNDEIKKILNYYQVASGEEFYLEYAFKATDYTDFIYRLAVVEQLSNYLNNTIDKYNQLIEENKKSINELANKKSSLKVKEDELSNEYKKLEQQVIGIDIAGVSIQDEMDTIAKSIKLYQDTYKCSDNEDISACIDRYNRAQRIAAQNKAKSQANYNVPSAAGFYVPITYWTGTYEFRHHDNGFDLSTPEGQEVHPIADGVVIDIWYKYSCGGNMIWIAHNVNGQKYTSAYFHMKTVNVSLDQTVTHNTVIGLSGGARRGTSTNTYDNCTTGPHLHLQTSYGHYDRTIYYPSEGRYHISYSAWNANSFNPRNIINF